MGNPVSKPEEEEPPNDTHPDIHVNYTEGNYQWPENLYDEAKDMAEVSFLIYMFARLIHVVRTHEEENDNANVHAIGEALQELEQTIDQGDSLKMRRFTPMQIQTIVRNHKDYLAKSETFGMNPQSLLDSLDKLIERVPENMPNALTLQDYDDIYQSSELVYAIGKDDLKKRITLILRGTESHSGSAYSNWTTNINIWKTEVQLPEITKEALQETENADMTNAWIHSGFYNYVFQKTTSTTDDDATTKFDEVIQQLKPLCQQYPDYKVYVTGHSLGAAMSTVFAFFLTNYTESSETEPFTFPQPISCLNFASPRVGDGNFLTAVTALEETGKLRMCRFVNDKDSITVVPSVNYYHVGFQVKLYAAEGTTVTNDSGVTTLADGTTPATPAHPPQVSYPKLVDSWWNKLGRAWDNGIISSLNLGYDHGSYRERILLNKAFLQDMDWNEWYAKQSEWTGFSVAHGKFVHEQDEDDEKKTEE